MKGTAVILLPIYSIMTGCSEGYVIPSEYASSDISNYMVYTNGKTRNPLFVDICGIRELLQM